MGNARRISLCNNCPKKGTFTMWAEHIVLLTRGSSSYPLVSFTVQCSYFLWKGYRGHRSNKGIHGQEIILSLCLCTTITREGTHKKGCDLFCELQSGIYLILYLIKSISLLTGPIDSFCRWSRKGNRLDKQNSAVSSYMIGVKTYSRNIPTPVWSVITKIKTHRCTLKKYI